MSDGDSTPASAPASALRALAAVELQLVLSFLSARDLCARAAPCSRQWAAAAQSPMVWQRYERGAPIDSDLSADVYPARLGRRRKDAAEPPKWTRSALCRRYLPCTYHVEYVQMGASWAEKIADMQRFGAITRLHGLPGTNLEAWPWEEAAEQAAVILALPSMNRLEHFSVFGTLRKEPLFSQILALPRLQSLEVDFSAGGDSDDDNDDGDSDEVEEEGTDDDEDGEGDDDDKKKVAEAPLGSAAAFAAATHLSRLTLLNCVVPVSSLVHIASIPHLQQLTLNAFNPDLEAGLDEPTPLYEDLSRLPALLRLTKLTRLDLLDVTMEAIGVDALAACLRQMPLLVELRFPYTEFPPLLSELLAVGAAGLPNFRHLRWFDSRDGPPIAQRELDWSSLERLLEAFPDLRVCTLPMQPYAEAACCSDEESPCRNRLCLSDNPAGCNPQ